MMDKVFRVASKSVFSGMHSATSHSSAHQNHHVLNQRSKVVRDGVVNCMRIDPLETSHVMDKCRLVLSYVPGRCAFLLEFYSPIKARKPKFDLFSFLITEVRETTALEMPDRDHTFVLKAEDQVEYIIEAKDSEDLKLWISCLQNCIHLGSTSSSSSSTTTVTTCTTAKKLITDHNQVSGSTNQATNLRSSDPGTLSSMASLSLTPRASIPQSGQQSVSPHRAKMQVHIPETTSNPSSPSKVSVRPDRSFCCPSAGFTNSGKVSDAAAFLSPYPWFHGSLPRTDAATAVLRDGFVGHGIFLVRQSETRKGEFVLTFNFQGRAKHLRMLVGNEGQCRVQHLWFQSMFDMLEYFKVHSIPLESGGATADVNLTEFVIRERRGGQSGATAVRSSTPSQQRFSPPTVRPIGRRTSPTHSIPSPEHVIVSSTGILMSNTSSNRTGRARAASISESQDILTYGGSVRLTSDSLDNLLVSQSISSVRDARTLRAVANTYSLI